MKHLNNHWLVLLRVFVLLIAVSMPDRGSSAQNTATLFFTPTPTLTPSLTVTPIITPLPSSVPANLSPISGKVEAKDSRTGANVRSAPSVDAPIIGKIFPGQLFPLIGRFDSWLQIQYSISPEGFGWVHEGVVTVTGISADQIPTVGAPSLIGSTSMPEDFFLTATAGVPRQAVQATPAFLESTRLVGVRGGKAIRGTYASEAKEALTDCIVRDQGKCDDSLVEDSFPARPILLSDFEIEQYEVTNEQYVAFLNHLGPNSHINGCSGKPCVMLPNATNSTGYIVWRNGTYQIVGDGYRLYPATFITWYGADAYCRAIERRLPTEAEWEWATRAPDGRIYPWGNNWNPLSPAARVALPGNQHNPAPINAYPYDVSASGVFDLGGNVAEWTFDWYSSDYYGRSHASLNPTGQLTGETKVVRGGDWDSLPFYARAVQRRNQKPLSGSDTIGFRCAR